MNNDSKDSANKKLIDQLRNGDHQALAELFSQHRERLQRLVSFRLDPRLSSRLDAEDVLQEAYLAAAARIAHFQGNPHMSFFVWLRQIVLQTMIDIHRRHMGAQMRSAQKEVSPQLAVYPQATSISLAAIFVGQITSPSQVAIREEASQKLKEAIERMSPLDQEILALRHFEELSNGEIAEILNLSPKAASIRYVRAVARLKSVLEKIPGFFEAE